MKRFLFIILFLLGAFWFVSVKAQGASAANITFGFYADNTQGKIAVTVSYKYYDVSGSLVSIGGNTVNTKTIAAGGYLNIVDTTVGTYNPEYKLKWSTDCDDPPASPWLSGTNNAGDAFVVFAAQRVHPTTTCSEPQITSTSCAMVNWTVVGAGSGGPNIDHFLVFKSLGGNADLDPSPATEPGTARSHNFGALGSGTWNIRVSAVSPPSSGSPLGDFPNGRFSAPSYGSFTCGSAVTPATGLSASPGCSGSTVSVNFYWTVASGATFTRQTLDYSTSAIQPIKTDASWTYVKDVTVGTGNTNVLGAPFNPNLTYWWRINSQEQSGTWDPADPPAQFTTVGCASGTFNPASNLNQTTCWNADPGSVYFTWTNGTAPAGFSLSQVWLDISLAANFPPGAYTNGNQQTVGATSFTKTGITAAAGTQFYWRVNTLFSDGQWRPSGTATFIMPNSPCTVLPSQPLSTLPPPVGCGPGCTYPSLTFTWSAVTAYATYSNLSSQKGQCSTTLNHCQMGGFTPGVPGGYTVYEGPSQTYPVLTSGNATSDSSGNVNLNWQTVYEVKLSPGGYDSLGVTGTSKTYSNLSPSTTYTVTVCAPDCGTSGRVSDYSYSQTTGNCICSPPPPVVVADFGINLTPQAPNNQTIQAGQSTSYMVTITSFNSFASPVSLSHNLAVSGATISFASSSVTPPANGTTSTTLNVSSTTSAATGTFNFTVTGNYNSGTLVHSASGILVITSPPVIPNNPSNLTVGTSCIGAGASATPQLVFSWTDNATNEDLYWIDVSLYPFTGPMTTSGSGAWANEWGNKTRNSSAAEKAGTGVLNFTWNNGAVANTSGPLDYGLNGSNTDPTYKTPAENTTYYWRVKAHSNTGGDSQHIYPDGGTGTQTPTGVAVTTPNCVKKYDLSPSFEIISGTTQQVYQVNDTATLRVAVTEKLATSTDNFPGKNSPGALGVWFKGPPPAPGSPMPSCPGSGAAPPNDPVGASEDYPIPAITRGSTQYITVKFNVGTTTGTFTAHAYAITDCTIATGVDPDYTNNSTLAPGNVAFTYSVGVNTWYQTLSGDVGARTATNVSQVPPAGSYQTDYLMGSQSVGSNIRVNPGGWSVNNYGSRLVPSGGIYNYFADVRRRAMATPSCTIAAAPATDSLYYCSGDITVGSLITISGGHNSAYFIDGNLNVNQNITVPIGTADTIVFIVGGDINIDANVTQADGVYIAKRNFNSASGTPTGNQLALVVHGAVYNDGDQSGKMNLSRILTPVANNTTTAAEQLTWQPKYLVGLLNRGLPNLIGKAALAWKEVAP